MAGLWSLPHARCPLLSPSGGPRRSSASRRGGSWSGPGPAPPRSTPLCGAAGSGSPSSATASRTCTPGSKPWPRRLPSTWTSWARRPAPGPVQPEAWGLPPVTPATPSSPTVTSKLLTRPQHARGDKWGLGRLLALLWAGSRHSNYIYHPSAACLVPVLVMTSLGGVEPQVGDASLSLVPRCGGPAPVAVAASGGKPSWARGHCVQEVVG